MDQLTISVQRAVLELQAQPRLELRLGTLPGGDPAGAAAAAVAAHESAADPHPGYLSQGEGDARYQPLAASLTTLASVTPGAGGLAILDDATLAAVRASLGIPEPLVLSADVTDSTGTLVAVNDLSFQPAAGGVYLVEVWGSFAGAATTTGLVFKIDPGTGAGSTYLFGRNTSDTTQTVRVGIAGASVTGMSSSAAGADTPFFGWAIIRAAASSPTPIVLCIATEIVGSLVTLNAGECFMQYRRIA